MKKRLSATNFSSENNLLTFRLNALTFALMATGAFSRNIGKLISELKLVTDNLLFIHTILISYNISYLIRVYTRTIGCYTESHPHINHNQTAVYKDTH